MDVFEILRTICDENNKIFDVHSDSYDPSADCSIDCWTSSDKKQVFVEFQPTILEYNDSDISSGYISFSIRNNCVRAVSDLEKQITLLDSKIQTLDADAYALDRYDEGFSLEDGYAAVAAIKSKMQYVIGMMAELS